MELIDPINASQQQLVVSEVRRYMSIASEFYQRDIPTIPVNFDLRGRAAGMYKIHGARKWLRFNPYLFAKYFEENLLTTVPHEVAHYISDLLHGMRRIRPHGHEWQSIMQLFGADAQRTHNFDMQGIPQRQYQRFDYQCQCQVYQLSSRRHLSIQRGERQYVCRQCRATLNLKTRIPG